MRQVVRNHVLGLGRDGGLCFQISIARAITQDLHALLEVTVTEYILERCIHALSIRHLGIVGAPLVDDLQGHAVLDRLAHRVLVDVVTEHPLCLINGSARVADAGGVGNALVEIGSEPGVLRAVCLIGHHQNVRAGV